jgi:hypothetical protein
MGFAVIIVVVVLLLALLTVWHRLHLARRADYIRAYPLPRGLLDKLARRHPQLGPKELQLVSRGLRHFFLAYLKGGRQPVSMPSQVADDLWHEFILYTRHYQQFCNAAFGRFLHHTPAAVLSSQSRSNAGLRRVWWQCCREENIHPRTPSRLPLLFALDAKFAIAGGFHYSTDCQAAMRRKQNEGGDGGSVVYCGGDFASDSVDGSIDGFGDGSADAGGGDGDGSGCGGGGCSD